MKTSKSHTPCSHAIVWLPYNIQSLLSAFNEPNSETITGSSRLTDLSPHICASCYAECDRGVYTHIEKRRAAGEHGW